tara:strand:+ start:590 stop:739 length:150 start_codon:yes stop_codon:yes gene_type:complete
MSEAKYTFGINDYLVEVQDRKKKKEWRYRVGGSNRTKKKQKWFIGVINE